MSELTEVLAVDSEPDVFPNNHSSHVEQGAAIGSRLSGLGTLLKGPEWKCGWRKTWIFKRQNV